MKIEFLPFKYVNALTDIKNGIIYLSNNIDSSIMDDVIIDESAHIISGSRHHKKRWMNACKYLSKRIPEHNSDIDRLIDKNLNVFGKDIMLGSNVGNITGISNMLLDYHLLQSYRKFSQKILGTEGSWEVAGSNKIRLKPTPKGSFPVVIRYLPNVTEFKLPSCREVCLRFLLAEAKIMLGHTRRKMSIPSPDGGQMSNDGDALVSEGTKERDEAIKYAINLGEPLGFIIK